ncbi:MAG: cobalt transporter [Propionibacteriaceae bacterium]|jgi:Co/Zn/Cd efflux system component|nr:cobalt transporter [Propionibacteriaceae bacterium]
MRSGRCSDQAPAITVMVTEDTPATEFPDGEVQLMRRTTTAPKVSRVTTDGSDVLRLRRIVLIVALINFVYFFVEFTVALAAGSVSLLADSVDFLEDTSVNLLVFIALGWPLAGRALLGKAMALVILVPASLAGWQAIQRFDDPQAPNVVPLVLVSLGAIAVNGTAAALLVRVRQHGGSLSRAAFLSARNDVLVNLSIIAMGGVTHWTDSGWPDLVLGCFIIALALHAAWEVWEVSEEERLAAKALEGEVG